MQERSIRPQKWLFFDLDDTLISSGQPISPCNWRIMEQLHRQGVKIVPASGRNWKTLHDVLPLELPIDYAIYSTGAGIVEWETQREIRHAALTQPEIRSILTILKDYPVDFMLHYGWPDNHRFLFFRHNLEETANPDFFRRLHCQSDALPLQFETLPEEATQFLLILPPEEKQLARELKARLNLEFSVVQATSPLDHQSIWLEVFTSSIDKASGARWLLEHCAVGNACETFAIGNDHNDHAMLEFADHALLMPDAPSRMQQIFPVVRSTCAELLKNALLCPNWQALLSE